MESLPGGRLVARMLKKEGVGTVFTLSGLHVAPIYAGCVDEGVRIVDTRHEQAAAHAADAWARLTRGVGVAIVTAGPGVTDAVTGVANAWAAASPLVLLGGAAPTFNQGRGSLQEMPQVQLFQGITKWSERTSSRTAPTRRSSRRSRSTGPTRGAPAIPRSSSSPSRSSRARNGRS